jgi:hypothetical protein
MEVRLFAVTVAMTTSDSRSDLLVMASVLHRRAVNVVEAELSTPSQGRRVFSATFQATPQKALTVLNSLKARVDVVDAELCAAADSRSDWTAPAATT